MGIDYKMPDVESSVPEIKGSLMPSGGESPQYAWGQPLAGL